MRIYLSLNKGILSLFALLLFCLSLCAQNGNSQCDYYNTIIGRIDPYSDINYYKLVPSGKKRFVYAYGADHHFIDSNALIFQHNPTNMLMEYSRQNENEWQLYSQIKDSITINAAIIDTLYLDSLAVKSGNDWVIPYQIHFENSYIRCIKFLGQDQGNKLNYITLGLPKIIFQKRVTFKLCTFTGIYFKNIIFNEDVVLMNNFTFGRYSDGIVFDNVEFKSKARIINNYISQITHIPLDNDQPSTLIGNKICNWAEKVFDRFYSDPFTGTEVQPAYKVTSTCIFYDEAVIYNNNPFYSFDFSGVTFKGRTYITSLFSDQLRLKYNDTQAGDFPEIIVDPSPNTKFPICNMSFNSANFLHTVSFNNQCVNSIDLRDAFFSGTLMLFNTLIKDSLKTNNGFYYSHFSSGLDIVLNPSNFSLASLNINPVSIEEVNFVYCKTNPAIPVHNKALLDNVNSFYNKLINDIKISYSQSHDLTVELENKYRHQLLILKMDYLRNNLNLNNIIELFRLSFLEFVVGNGYKGGDNFLVSSLLIITAFAYFYYIFYQKPFIEYINVENGEKAGSGKKQKNGTYNSKDYTKNFLKCFWKSFYIFFNPKPSFSYFNFQDPLFALVAIEWLIGIFMISLFLIYVASTYPFIRSLLGL
ncbi:hypothetical protein SAMN04488505_1011433 [Chitinophaga rupis]|uniref:Pentapeptide repeat-containing protein n=1 Tax=Chitinophaga rupis TaxID=573321 RepID=A0A1H7M8C3_9BACT|nr:hypothetical protein SAMN04488505_1011433 [Chitinophaga rupis]